MRIGQHEKLVMIGDSITDCGRARPVGEGLFDAIGKGYVGVVDALLTSTYPELGIRVVNMGSSGNTVRDLNNRWQTDVHDLKPDWLSIMIGTNDVWRQFDSPTNKESHVYLEEYEATLEALVAATLPKLKGLVLLTPFYIEPNPNDAMRAQMDRYGAAVKRIAAKYDTLFVDTQEAFNRVLEHLYSGTIAWDRVHPNQTGHAVIARAFLQAIGYEYDKGL
ncbi:SGNH/GDSL hydrolase family protein [Paenibacillus sacheonensis]|uniref:GDSL family lipase n=1 Tax=Paenibacillus sacheonensis TaxID=742054 RepID=A0A7X4YNZ5_9BACL|nr:SGNH/GDSL hydrolase family protein [Paenibacillus sacheonensis]MBM7567398.1 lysophospholipase L1-like esterase [Paenibacillus sacheonensis]NBC69820.1 GDSL family lipase [Paenibacillus sacheonensis]